jgi:hypothetical protein
MKTSQTLVPLGLLVASLALVTVSFWNVSRGIAEQPGTNSDINLRYASALSKLAKHELQQALTENQITPGTFTNVTVQRLKGNALIAEERLQHVLNGKEHRLHQVHLRELEGNLKIAELNLQNALRLNDRIPSMVSTDEVEGLRMSLEVARLAMKRAQGSTVTDSSDAHIQWQFDHLRQEILRLQTRVAKLETLAHR